MGYSEAQPDFLSVGSKQIRIWKSAEQSQVLVLPGLYRAARTRADFVGAQAGELGVTAVDLLHCFDAMHGEPSTAGLVELIRQIIRVLGTRAALVAYDC